MRTCPRSAPPSTPNDRFDPFSSRPSSPPRLPSTPKRHLQVSTLCLKTAACFHAFMGICSCLLAGDNTKKHTLKRGLSTLMRTAETILKRHSVAKCNKQAVRRRSNAGGGGAACTGGLIGRSIMRCGRHQTGREMRVIADVSGKGAMNARCL